VRRLHASSGATFYLDDADPAAPALVTVLDADPPPARLLELETEFRVTRELHVPGVRRALARTEVEGRPALRSTWFAGNPFDEAFASRPSLERSLDVALRAAEIVARLHAARLMHGRIGPRAFRVDAAFREVELSGLGYATGIDAEIAAATLEDFASEERGAFASPEQTGRTNRPVDWRSDLYSLGATLYLLFTGRPPFEATDAAELAYRLIAVRPVPPRELVPGLPEALSDIVMKLLAKDAEDRYQSAEALCADLAFCRQYLPQGIPPFALAREDQARRFRLPRKLHGREREVASLLERLERSSAGSCEMVLVAGVAGVGKTALVRELLRPLGVRRGRYLEGKFDQFQRELPFSAFAQAFSMFVHAVLSGSESELELLRARIREAVGELGGLLTQLVPDLELLIGAQRAVPELGPVEAQNRFQYVLRRFLLSICDENHPLVLFIDDLQWADPGSLGLLSTLMSRVEARHLLVVAAYRAEEVGATHAFRLCIDDMERAGAPLHELSVEALGLEAVTELVADSLSSRVEQVAELARSIWAQTQGNALFVRQLLRSLYDDGSVRFNANAAAWEWHALGEESGSRDVLSLLAQKTAGLPDDTREALSLGACLGIRFDAALVAAVQERELAEVGRALEPAIREGLIAPVGAGHRYLAAGLSPAAGQDAGYVFLHDRVQQAVYAGIPAEERPRLHLKVGRCLLTLRGVAPGGIFQLAHQLNLGRALVTELAELRRMAEINLEAGLAAKRSAAYATALEYFGAGIQLLGTSAWEREHALMLRLHSEAAECAYLCTSPETMERHIEAVLSRGKDVLEKASVYLLRVDAYTSQNRLSEALKAGLVALKELGVSFPKSPKLPHIMAGLLRTKLILARKDVRALAKQRLMTDPKMHEAMLLLERMVPPAYMSGNPLFPLLVFAMVDLSVKHGNSPLSAFGYGSFGITLAGVVGDIPGGTLFGQLAMDTLEATRADTFRVKVLFVLYVFIQHWTEHLNACTGPLLDAYRVGMEAGNLVGATWSAHYRLLWMYFTARPLAELEREAATYSGIFHQLGQQAAYRRNDMLRQTMLNLMGQSSDPIAFSGETYDDGEIAKLSQKGDDATSRFFYHANKQWLSYLFGHVDDAVRHGDAAAAFLESVTGLPDVPLRAFVDGLARVRKSERARSGEAAKLLRAARKHLAKLEGWSRHGPQNYRHKHDLLAAEIARVEERSELARSLYDSAIEGAARNGYLQEAALAEELAGLFHAQSGRRELAAFYLRRARGHYVKWGAMAKAEAMEREHRELLDEREPHTAAAGELSIDLGAVVKATAAISSEIVLDRLAAKLLDIAVENAGAERALLVLYQDGEGKVVARKASTDAPETGLTLPLTEQAAPASLIQYVVRTKRPLVLDDARDDSRFLHDPYFRARAVRSALCAPIVHHGDVIAILYLENGLLPRAFTASRLSMLALLGGQMAVSLENARLYGNLQASLDRQVALTHAYSRFTPRAFLDFLDRASILDVKLGDHRHGDMTVMFLDIRGYTSLSEQLSVDENFRFLNGFMPRMTAHIAQRSGVVARFTGDGIMAFFPERPADAVAACVAMRSELRRYNAERAQKGRPQIDVGIGLHTGPLMIGVIGDQERLETTLISDTVNTAARMEGLTKEFQVGIIASETTISALGPAERRDTRCVGDVLVKGKSYPTRVFDIFGGDGPQVVERKRQTADEFAKGVAAWRDGDLSLARSTFEHVLSENPADATARRYALRAASESERGVSGEWTGVEVMAHK
jgi:predicted ATPase/class 3 adenylate cyclase